MAFYALGIKPLVDDLATATKPSVCKQSWYADDSSAGGKIEGIKIWWDTLLEQGPMYGYYPKASKTVLIVKNSEDLDLAQKVFSGTGIKIESEGERHLGSAIQNDTIKSLKAIKEKHLFTVSKSIEDSVRDPNLKRSLQFIKEKGSGCWLTALPLKRFGYSLNKIEFRYALYLR